MRRVQGKHVTAVAAAKRHTVAMTADGDVYTWGHKTVTPRRVQLAGARDTCRAGGSAGSSVTFHKGQAEVARPTAVRVAAGAAHSCALTRGGVVLAWRSWDPALAVREVGGVLAGRKVVDVAAGASGPQ
jgi:inhibitor of Bruton tyrosine kinase